MEVGWWVTVWRWRIGDCVQVGWWVIVEVEEVRGTVR